MIISEVSCWSRSMYVAMTCVFFISTTQSQLCVRYLVIKLCWSWKPSTSMQLTVELLASLQQMTNWFIIMIQILLYSLLTHMYGSCWRIVAVLTEIIWNILNTMLCCRVQIEHQPFFISVARSIVVIVHASKDFLFMKSLMDETNTKVQYIKT